MTSDFLSRFQMIARAGADALSAAHDPALVCADFSDMAFHGVAPALPVWANPDTLGEYFSGTSGDDTQIGTVGNDAFDYSQGGNDTLYGGDGADKFIFGGAFDANDRVDGGTSSDTLVLKGDYTVGQTWTAQTLTNVETIQLDKSPGYFITFDDGNVAAGALLIIKGQALKAGSYLVLDGSHETDGAFLVYGSQGDAVYNLGAGDDTVYGGSGNEIIFTGGGKDFVVGGGGNDYVSFDAGTFAPDDYVNGGAGIDTVSATFGADSTIQLQTQTIADVETLNVEAQANAGDVVVTLTMADGNVASGQTLNVFASNGLNATMTLTFDGSAETDGHFDVTGMDGDDNLRGGALADTLKGAGGHDILIGFDGNDVIDGGHGGDELIGGNGADTIKGGAGDDFFLASAGESVGPTHDTIVGFDAAADLFALDVAVNAVDDEISGGTLRAANFNADIEAAVGRHNLAVGDAVLFAPDAGNLAGHTFLIVDANGIAGYQGGHDYVFELSGAVHLGQLSADNFQGLG